jgi:3-oxoacyl-[acyl-carrier protein] reductase
VSGVAVVTGGARNLGRAIVLALARAGHDVVVNARTDVEGAEKVAAEAREIGVRAMHAMADVAVPEQVARMFAAAEELGPVRVLVNNAAVRTRVSAYDVTTADWEVARRVTLDGAMHCVFEALPRLRSAGGGAIVSVIGGNALRGDPHRFHVSAAKYGLVGMTKGLAAACAADGITANAVSPSNMEPGPDAAAGETQRRRDAVAAAVAFLASPCGADVTGQLIEVGTDR